MSFCPCAGPRKKKEIKKEQQPQQVPDSNKTTVRSIPSDTETSTSTAIQNRGNESNPPNKARTLAYRDLATATNNFREESFIGKGGFGTVFRGRLENGLEVAVKQLDQSGFQGEKEFLVEVLMLSLLQHPNLVTLIGYCAEGNQRLLVYEYMPLGSLDDHLHDLPPNVKPLDWNTRMTIAAGAAKGLEHLHNVAKPPVIYRDLKTSNILLGDNYFPKLSDFGLAKFGPTGDRSHVSTRVMGTRGYCAPDYANTGKLTTKTDIFSYGVLLLELITGQKALDDSRGRDKRFLVDWAISTYRECKSIRQMADPLLKGRFADNVLKKAIEVAFLCVQEKAHARPGIAEVVIALNYLVARPYHHNESNSTNQASGSNDPSTSDKPRTRSRDMDREQAVAEAKMWGDAFREKRQ
ncbi:hypothetical protein ACFE04_010344 [Oxalis oulophora]